MGETVLTQSSIATMYKHVGCSEMDKKTCVKSMHALFSRVMVQSQGNKYFKPSQE